MRSFHGHLTKCSRLLAPTAIHLFLGCQRLHVAHVLEAAGHRKPCGAALAVKVVCCHSGAIALEDHPCITRILKSVYGCVQNEEVMTSHERQQGFTAEMETAILQACTVGGSVHLNLSAPGSMRCKNWRSRSRGSPVASANVMPSANSSIAALHSVAVVAKARIDDGMAVWSEAAPSMLPNSDTMRSQQAHNPSPT
jgi:hypothetical protein